MCGFVGYISKEKNKENTIKEMNDLIAHRGPDDEGYYTDEDIALGFRRLSIIDLNTGSQPIYNDDKSKLIVFNGEIYNYRELKEELVKKGYKFKTKTDTGTVKVPPAKSDDLFEITTNTGDIYFKVVK